MRSNESLWFIISRIRSSLTQHIHNSCTMASQIPTALHLPHQEILPPLLILFAVCETLGWGSSGRKEKKVCPPYIQTVHNIVAMLSTTATGYVSKAKIIMNTLLGWLLLPPHLPNTPRPWMERSMFDAQNADMVEAYGYALTLMQCIKWITIRRELIIKAILARVISNTWLPDLQIRS